MSSFARVVEAAKLWGKIPHSKGTIRRRKRIVLMDRKHIRPRTSPTMAKYITGRWIWRIVDGNLRCMVGRKIKV